MRLIIAEKPSVGASIADVFGRVKTDRTHITLENGDIVTWAVGHLIGLADPEEYDDKYKKWTLHDLPILPEQFKLTISNNTKGQYKAIKDLLKLTSEVIMATDAGREGQLIGYWILKKAGYKGKVSRLWIKSLTSDSIKKGFSALLPGEKFNNLSFSGEQRAIADWIVGMNATRAYTTIAQANGEFTTLTIGRVQTPTLALIVKREIEIYKFKSSPFWEVVQTFMTTDGEKFDGKAYFKDQEESSIYRILNKASAQDIHLKVNMKSGIVESVEQRTKPVYAPKFFNLVELQKKSNKDYQISADETLKAMQALYEAKYVTYPRTDSQYITRDIAAELPSVVSRFKESSWGSLIPSKIPSLINNKRYTNEGKVTDHHAILPTGLIPGSPLPSNQLKIYKMIVDNFIAAHHENGVDSESKIISNVDGVLFLSKGENELVPGWRIVYPNRKKASQFLPNSSNGDKLSWINTELKEGKTTPPDRYTESTLLAAMETAGRQIDDPEQREILIKKGGLGTSPTRSTIIEGLKKREYIIKEKNHLKPTKKGISLIKMLGNHTLTSPVLTAEWEELLQKIEAGTYSPLDFEQKVREFVKKTISTAAETKIEQSSFTIEKTPLGKCPSCGSEITLIKEFYGCSGYKKGCKFTIPTVKSGKKITPAQVKKLLTNGKTDLIKGFNGKKTFDSYLVINDGKVVFEFSKK
jgi:DNA topoisomerase III